MSTHDLPAVVVLDEELLDESGPHTAHLPCEETGPDEPIHSLCGAFVRGIPARPGDASCRTCQDMVVRQSIVTCPAHGSRVDPDWWIKCLP